MKKTIVYENPLEVKIVIYSVGGIWSALYLFVTICDLMSNNPVFWHNQEFLWILAVFFVTPIIIIARYRVQFDFEKRVFTYYGYFSPKKKYSFDEINAVATIDGIFLDSIRYTFFVYGKKIFTTTNLDFEKQTRKKSECLNEFLSLEGRFLYDVKDRINQAGCRFIVYTYAFNESIGIIDVDNIQTNENACDCYITVGYDCTKSKFVLKTQEIQYDKTSMDAPMLHKIVDEVVVDQERLEESILSMIEKCKCN